MKINKTIIGGLLFSTMILVGSSCNNENYLVFDEDYSGIYFTEDSIHYSFGTLPIEKREYIQEIPVKIMGAPHSKDRLFEIEVVPSKNNTTPQKDLQYSIESSQLLIKADSINGVIPVVLLRDGLEGDDQHGYTRYELRLKLIENNNFTPTLSEADNNVVITFDNSIDKPSWYNESVWLEKCGEWHPLKLIKLMEFFHTVLKEEAPSTYQKMVADIGENWEKVQFGWPTDYNYTIKKYILIPEFEYFKSHPEHGISDFPNPNAV